MHPVGARRTVHVLKIVGFGAFVQLSGTDIPGLLVWPNVPADEQAGLRGLDSGAPIEAVVTAHPDHHRQIWLTRIGVSDLRTEPR